jgi:Tfp pilus assembly protein PilF
MGIIDNLEAMRQRGQDSPLLRYGLGNEYAKQGQLGRALEHLAESVRMDPEYSAAWKLYGKVLQAASRHTEAVSAFDHGIATAERKGDVQAANEMRVFRKRSQKALDASGDEASGGTESGPA